MRVPVLRKDFTVDPRDVADARAMGADAVLLIVAALDDAELADLHDLAEELDLDVLVEVHDEAELARALAVGATIVGVNQRDLTTFEVDPGESRAGRARPCPTGCCAWRSPGSAAEPTPRSSRRPASTPCWWGSPSSPRAIGRLRSPISAVPRK